MKSLTMTRKRFITKLNAFCSLEKYQIRQGQNKNQKIHYTVLTVQIKGISQNTTLYQLSHDLNKFVTDMQLKPSFPFR